MKKSKKCDFKKLALLGLAGGTVLATQANAAEINNYSQLLAFNGCGGQHGCHGSEGNSVGGNGNGGYQAYRSTPSQDAYSYSNGQPSAGCSSNAQPQYYQQPVSAGCNANAQPQYYQQPVSASCSANAQPQYYQQAAYQYSQPSHGCATAYEPRGQSQNYQDPYTAYGAAGGAGSAGTSAGTSGYQGTPGTSGYQGTQPGQSNYLPQSGQSGQMPRGQQSSPTNSSKPLSAANQNGTYTQWETKGYTADASTSNTQRPLTESGLLSRLNEQGKAAYQSLDSAGKALALKMANQDCKGQNECKGLNSCKTSDHACAGKGSCAGTAASNFKDKNLAVKVAALKMAEKRANAASSKSS